MYRQESLLSEDEQIGKFNTTHVNEKIVFICYLHEFIIVNIRVSRNCSMYLEEFV